MDKLIAKQGRGAGIQDEAEIASGCAAKNRPAIFGV